MVEAVWAQREMPITWKPALPAGRALLFFGIQQPEAVNRATLDIVSKVTQSRSVLYAKVCAVFLQLFIKI
jgi:hypothetical protein